MVKGAAENKCGAQITRVKGIALRWEDAAAAEFLKEALSSKPLLSDGNAQTSVAEFPYTLGAEMLKSILLDSD